MVEASDIEELRHRLEALRDRLTHARAISEEQVAPVLADTQVLLEAAQGGPYEETLQVIHTLVESVWRTSLQQDRLHEAYATRRDAD